MSYQSVYSESGKYRHYVAIETPTNTKSTTGAITQTWSTFNNVWVSIETLKTFERQAANETYPGTDSLIKLRFISGLLPTMRINYKSKIYSILGINNVEERDRVLELYCQSGIKAI